MVSIFQCSRGPRLVSEGQLSLSYVAQSLPLFGLELRHIKVANALKSCFALSGLRSRPSPITFLLLLMSRLLRCYVSLSSTLFSYLFYGSTSLSSVIFSWSRSLSCLSSALHCSAGPSVALTDSVRYSAKEPTPQRRLLRSFFFGHDLGHCSKSYARSQYMRFYTIC